MPQAKSITYLGVKILHQRNSWRAYLPKVRGKGRERHQSTSLDQVKAWIRANIGTAAEGGEVLTAAQTADYIAAMALLPPGISMAEAARMAAAQLPGAAANYQTTVEQAVAGYIETKRASNRRPRTVESTGWACRKLSSLYEKPVATVTPAQISTLISHGQTPGTRDSIRRQLSTFFDWCKASGYCMANPCAPVPATHGDWQPPGIYTPKQVQAVLSAAEEHFPRAVPMLAILFFAGVRISGAAELSSESINMKAGSILVHAGADKLRQSYYTPINQTLRKWLKAYPPEEKICPWELSYTQRQLTKRVFKPAGVPRIRNGARHSFASALLATTQDAPKVAMALGHFHGDTATLFTHYRHRITPAIGRAYFDISPQSGRNLATQKQKPQKR